jgi:patatin-like phospholipase/acyl hydrolase
MISTAPVDGGSEATPEFHILALSGGGYRGLYSARILADIEQHIGASVATRFDLLAGTSIGGILALALALEVPAERMVTLFERHGDAIFRKRRSLFGLWRSPYTQQALADLLRQDELFGQRTLDHVRHPVIVPAINYSTGRPVVFKTPHHSKFFRDCHHQLVDIAMATSAAPGYFPRHVFNDNQYVDGGLFANAPGMLAVHEARQFFDCNEAQLTVVAVGTMSSKFTVDPRRNRQGGTFDWGGLNPTGMPKRLFGLAISAQESMTDHVLHHRLGSRYFHIDDDLTDERARAVALDTTTKAAREVLLGAASERSKHCLGDPRFRQLLTHCAPAARFHHGIHAPTPGVQLHAEVAQTVP